MESIAGRENEFTWAYHPVIAPEGKCMLKTEARRLKALDDGWCGSRAEFAGVEPNHKKSVSALYAENSALMKKCLQYKTRIEELEQQVADYHNSTIPEDQPAVVAKENNVQKETADKQEPEIPFAEESESVDKSVKKTTGRSRTSRK